MRCEWTTLDNGRLYCPVCDPDKKQTQRRDTRRWCGPLPDSLDYEPPPPQPFDAAAWFTDHYAKAGATSPSLDELLVLLDRCLNSGCEHLTANVCRKWRGSSCERYEIWFQRLMLHGCDAAQFAQREA